MRSSDGRSCPVSPEDERVYLLYPTLTDLPKPSVPAPCPVFGKKKKRVLLELVVALAVLVVLVGSLLESGPVPAPHREDAETERLLETVMLTETAALVHVEQTETMEQPAQTTEPVRQEVPFSEDLVLRNYDPEGYNVYTAGTKIWKSDVFTVTFLDSLDQAGEDAIDVSETGNGRVLLWSELRENGKYDLYIAGDGKVFFPENCGYLFGIGSGTEYRNLRQINFGDAVDTSHVRSMKAMFRGCRKLEHLDLSSFDTSQVTDMRFMCSCCPSLVSVDLSGFDTGNVTLMGWMFEEDTSLASLDLDSFTTDNVENISYMFYHCSGLERLDTGNMKLDSVRYTGRMFRGCRPDLMLITDDSSMKDQFHEDMM